MEEENAIVHELVALGFEEVEVRCALAAGMVQLDEAVNWMLEQRDIRENAARGATGDGTLTLRVVNPRPPAPEPVVPFVTVPSVSPFPNVFAPESAASYARDANVTGPSSRWDAFPDREKQISEAEESERQAMIRKAKEKRQRETLEKQRILKEIEDDKNTRKNRRAAPVASAPQPSQPAPVAAATASAAAKTTIQIRLSTGRAVRHVLDADTPMTALYDIARREGEPSHDFFFVQPFPQKSYESFYTETLRSLGLVPNASLAVRPRVAAPAVQEPAEALPVVPVLEVNEDEDEDAMQDVVHTPSQGQQHDDDGGDDDAGEDDDDGGDDILAATRTRIQARLAAGRARVGRPPSRNFLGSGNVLGGSSSASSASSASAATSASATEDARNARLRRLQQTSSDNMDVAPAPVQPVLSATVSPTIAPVQLPARPQAQAAALTRLQQQQQQQQPVIDTPLSPTILPVGELPQNSQWRRRVRRLELMALDAVANLVSNRTLCPDGKTLRVLGPDVGGKVVHHLASTGRLDKFTMNRLASTHPSFLKLDSYKYATNELLGAIGRLSFLKALSLREAPYITDQGLDSITSLKNLTNLDVSMCKLTTKCVPYLTKFTKLQSLGLRRTKIDDNVVEELVHAMPHLESIDLSLCPAITSTSLFYLKNLANLRHLALDDTSVRDLSEIAYFKKSLQTLTLARNRIDSESFFHVGRCKSLQRLDLLATGILEEDIVAIKDLPNLTSIVFPDHNMLMDSLLEYFKDLHWQTVDFGGFVNLTDEGVRHLASMKDSIRVLTLSGTRITNASLAIIAEMSDLRELYLDRTFINDEGAKKLCVLRNLEVLSLAETGISDLFLLPLSRSQSRTSLRRLNFNKTSLSDDGIGLLREFPLLTHLSIDNTQVNRTALSVLDDLPNLQPVRLFRQQAPADGRAAVAAAPIAAFAHDGDDDGDDGGDDGGDDDDMMGRGAGPQMPWMRHNFGGHGQRLGRAPGAAAAEH